MFGYVYNHKYRGQYPKNIHCDENYIGGACYHPTEIGFLQLHQNRHVTE